MAKKRQVYIDVIIDDKGTTKRVAVSAKKLGVALEQGGRSAQSADRQLKGVAQTSANMTKNNAKMAQGITGGLVPAYATLAANIFAISAAFNFLKRAADVSDLSDSQMEFARATGTALESMTTGLREASAGMLGFREAAEAAAIGVAKGFTRGQLEDLAEGARKASQALGRDFEDSFNRLLRGVSKAEPELLDELGITLRLETATKDYAAALDKSVDSLTAVERSQAVLASVQKDLNKQFGAFKGKENAFVRLQKSFDDIVRNLTEFFLPAFERLALLIADNASIAFAFFGVIAAGILRSMPFVKELDDTFDEMLRNQQEEIDETNLKMQEYTDSIEAAQQALREARDANVQNYGDARQGAQDVVQELDARKGSGLEKLQKGEDISERQRVAMLRAARDNVGEYQKLDEKRRLNFINELEIMGRAEKKSVGRTRRGYEKITFWAKSAVNQTKRLGNAYRAVGKAATAMSATVVRGFKKVGGAFDKLLRITVVGAVLKEVGQGIMSFIEAPIKIVDMLLSGINMAIDAFIYLSGIVSDFMKYLFDIQETQANSKANLDKIGESMKKGAESLVDDGLGIIGTSIGELRREGEELERSNAFKNFLVGMKDDAGAFAKELKEINKGIADQGNAAQRGLMKATGMSTAGISGQIAGVVSAASVHTASGKQFVNRGRFREGLEEYLKMAGNEIKALSPEIHKILLDAVGNPKIFTTGGVNAWIANIESMEKKAASFIANTRALRDMISTMSQNVDIGDLMGVRGSLDEINNTKTSIEGLAEALNITSEAAEYLDNIFEGFGGLDKYRQKVDELIGAQEKYKDTLRDTALFEQQANRAPGVVGSQMQKELDVMKARNELQATNNRLNEISFAIKQAQLNLGDPDTAGSAKQRIAELSREQTQVNRDKLVQLATLDEAKRSLTEMGQIGDAVGASLTDGLVGAFQGIIDGTKSAKVAFKEMGLSILKVIARIITELMVAKLLVGALGGTAFGDFVGIPNPGATTTGSVTGGITGAGRFSGYAGGYGSGKTGLYPPLGYSTGGIARGPMSGYPAILHGNEAVVPLPDGKRIPVDFKGGASTNNVVVNVNIDERGGATQNSTSDSQDGERLGRMVAKAVQDELQYQKRSGGILNPYGVA